LRTGVQWRPPEGRRTQEEEEHPVHIGEKKRGRNLWTRRGSKRKTRKRGLWEGGWRASEGEHSSFPDEGTARSTRGDKELTQPTFLKRKSHGQSTEEIIRGIEGGLAGADRERDTGKRDRTTGSPSKIQSQKKYTGRH